MLKKLSKMGVSSSFNIFCDELTISSKKQSIISLRYSSINKKLNKDFWNIDTNSGGVYVGCYGKGTANDGINEIEMIFAMPSYLQEKYSSAVENGQLNFLEDVRFSISSMYPKTTINKQKQTIKVNFSDGMYFEVLPVFVQEDDTYVCADIKNEGCWTIKKMISDIQVITIADVASDGSLRKLAKMAKIWKKNCEVNIKDSLIDTLAYNFIKKSKYRYESYASYDVMCLNFFKYLMEQSRSKKESIIAGGEYQICTPSKFRYQAVIAYYKVKAAMKLDAVGKKWIARQKWRELFGDKFPEFIEIESQLKVVIEKTTLIYKTQKKCARLLSRHNKLFQGFQVVNIVILLGSIYMMGSSEYMNIAVSLFVISSLIFIINLYFKKHKLLNIASKHIESAASMKMITNQYKRLLDDLTKKHIDVAIIRDRQVDLQRNMNSIYQGTSKYMNKRYYAYTLLLSTLSDAKERIIKQPTSYNIPVFQKSSFQIDNQVQYLMNHNTLSSELQEHNNFV